MVISRVSTITDNTGLLSIQYELNLKSLFLSFPLSKHTKITWNSRSSKKQILDIHFWLKISASEKHIELWNWKITENSKQFELKNVFVILDSEVQIEPFNSVGIENLSIFRRFNKLSSI